MRIAFMQTLTRLVKKDPRIILVTGDLGFSVFDEFQKIFPSQYLNAGVAEQNMTGVAAGMSAAEKIPIIYSLVPFVTMRNFEQIRNDICYDSRNVKIVGVGAGFSYGIYGHTHYGLEDIGLMRTLPNMTIFSPGDPIEVAWATEQMVRQKGPCYMRLCKVGEPVVYNQPRTFKVGKGEILTEGSDVTIIATGVLLPRAIEVAALLRKRGYTSRVVSMHTIEPIDRELIIDCARKTRAVFTLEEHFVRGGLGSVVSEVLSESHVSVPFKRLGVTPMYFHATGSQEYMRTLTGLSALQLETSIMTVLSVSPEVISDSS